MFPGIVHYTEKQVNNVNQTLLYVQDLFKDDTIARVTYEWDYGLCIAVRVPYNKTYSYRWWLWWNLDLDQCKVPVYVKSFSDGRQVVSLVQDLNEERREGCCCCCCYRGRA